MKGSALYAPLALMVMGVLSAPAAAQTAGQPSGQQPPRQTTPAPAKPAQPNPLAPAPPPGTAAPAPTPAPATPPPPFPAGAKFAFINPQRIFQESADGKVALTRVTALTQKKQTENQQRQKALADNQQKLQTSGSLLSETARTTLEKEIEKQQVDMQRFQQDAQAEIQELQNEVQGEFVKKVSPILQQVAAEKGLQILFNAADAGFAWVDPGLDLTGEVIKKLDTLNKPSPPKN